MFQKRVSARRHVLSGCPTWPGSSRSSRSRLLRARPAFPSVVRAAGWIWMWFGVVQGKNRSGGRRRTDRPDGILQDATARRTVILQDAADVQPVGVGRPTGGAADEADTVGCTCTGVAETGQAGDHEGGHATPYCTSVATRQRPPSPSRFSYPCHHRLHPPACASAICRHAPAC